ncbi:MAG: hypothetical protein Q8P25_00085 [Candidatus Curtissbacteria bacterium]|nr:hypothetical protein [Candidatus Curtissbacteria bacterium]
MRLFLGRILITLFIAFTLTLLTTKSAQAGPSAKFNPDAIDENTPTVTVTFSGVEAGKKYWLSDPVGKNTFEGTANDAGEISFTFCGAGKDSVKARCGDGDFFHAVEYTILLKKENKPITQATFRVKHFYPDLLSPPPPQNPKPTDDIFLTLSGIRRDGTAERNDYIIKGPDGKANCLTLTAGRGSQPLGKLANGKYTIDVKDADKSCSGEGFIYYRITIIVSDNGGSVSVVKDPQKKDGGGTLGPLGVNPCTGGICKTGLGDIPTNAGAFVNKILSLAVGLAGGIALILMVIGSIRVLTSSGDQQKLSGGRDQIVAAVAGLLFLIFSVLILRFIGIEILGLGN